MNKDNKEKIYYIYYKSDNGDIIRRPYDNDVIPRVHYFRYEIYSLERGWGNSLVIDGIKNDWQRIPYSEAMLELI